MRVDVVAPALDAGILGQYLGDRNLSAADRARLGRRALAIRGGIATRRLRRRCLEPRGQFDLLHDPPGLHALLHHSIAMLSLWTLLFATLLRQDGRRRITRPRCNRQS